MQKREHEMIHPFPSSQPRDVESKLESIERLFNRGPFLAQLAMNIGAGVGVWLICIFGLGIGDSDSRDWAYVAIGILCVIRWGGDEILMGVRIFVLAFRRTPEEKDFDKLRSDNVVLSVAIDDLEKAVGRLTDDNNVKQRQIAQLMGENKILSVTEASQHRESLTPPVVDEQAVGVWEEPHEVYSPHIVEQTIIEASVKPDKHTEEQAGYARAILGTYARQGNVSRGVCMADSGISRGQWEKGMGFLELIGACGPNEHNAKTMLVDVAEAYSLIEKKVTTRTQEATDSYTPN